MTSKARDLMFLIMSMIFLHRLLKVDMLLIMLHKEHKVDSQGISLTRILKPDILVLVLEMTLCLGTTWAMDHKAFSPKWDSMIPCKMMRRRAISVWRMPTLFSPR
ncbi:uncharacterized protein LOC114915341 [Cajanus cajan]|uniref:uncharacterized protein LOC114915341 n=1 Tax=Cajanus cajan TaxID=3821 RepID=UPI0010FB626D|nr:uncharacterized protein LOC114915341 [Cajanus cajan]